MEIGRKRRGPLTAKDKIERNLSRKRGADILSFPTDLGVHSFLMEFVDYKFDAGAQGTEDINASIALPLPETGITDQPQLQYSDQGIGTISATLSSVGGELMNKLETAGTDAGGSDKPGKVDYSALTKDLMSLGAAGVRALNPSTDLKNAIDQSMGNVVNPHVALLFQQVGLKKFTLNWKLSPASEEESILLRRIINKIQKAIHPSFQEAAGEGGGNNFFLKYPNQVDCYYQGSGNFLHFFKRAAVTDFSVNYQGEGAVSLFADTGAPSVIGLTMGFQEVEIWTAEDYEEIDGGE